MKYRYLRDAAQLQVEVYQRCVSGRWTDQPNGVVMFRGFDGAVLQFAETTGRVWFQGPEGPRMRLLHQMLPVLIAIEEAGKKRQF